MFSTSIYDTFHTFFTFWCLARSWTLKRHVIWIAHLVFPYKVLCMFCRFKYLTMWIILKIVECFPGYQAPKPYKEWKAPYMRMENNLTKKKYFVFFRFLRTKTPKYKRKKITRNVYFECCKFLRYKTAKIHEY